MIACLDLEGVLTPEVWINVAERTGVEALRRTTRDEPDYDRLMRFRLDILDREGITLPTIQEVIDGMGPLPGAVEFLAWLKRKAQVIILSDTFYQFAEPLMRQLDFPCLFCHRLDVTADGRITGYRLRIEDGKRRAVEALRGLNLHIVAAGDSYNDTTMLKAAHAGILFRAPQKVVDAFPQFPAATCGSPTRHPRRRFAEVRCQWLRLAASPRRCCQALRSRRVRDAHLEDDGFA